MDYCRLESISVCVVRLLIPPYPQIIGVFLCRYLQIWMYHVPPRVSSVLDSVHASCSVPSAIYRSASAMASSMSAISSASSVAPVLPDSCFILVLSLFLSTPVLLLSCHTPAFSVVLHSCNFGVVLLIFFIFVIVLIVCQCRILIVVYMRYVNRRLLYFLFWGFRLPFHSCDIPVNFVEHFVRVVIWKNVFYRDASTVFKN